MSYTAKAYGMPSNIRWHHVGAGVHQSLLPDQSDMGLIAFPPPSVPLPLTPQPRAVVVVANHSVNSHVRQSSSANMDSLLLAASSEHATNGAYDLFHAHVDTAIFSEEDWVKRGLVGDLQSLTQQTPHSFGVVDTADLTTQACLCLTKQPGPVHVATSNARTEPFVVTLVTNPLLHQNIAKTWKVSNLKVHVHSTGLDDMDVVPAFAIGKKRPRGSGKKSGSSKSVNVTTEYPFDNAMKVSITNLVLPASGGRPVKLEFSCTVTDALGKSAVFTTASYPFVVVSNCNQWPVGLEVCFRRLVFANDKTQASFARFFNYLQLVFLATRCVEVERFFKPEEIYNWLVDSSEHCLRMDRDRQLLAVHGVVTMEMFDNWFRHASALIYDLHTSNVGKLFQHLWSRGFVGIGVEQPNGVEDDDFGTCRLSINTKASQDDDVATGVGVTYDGQSRSAVESYLVLEATLDASKTRRHTLLALERDYLPYFFEHSRHSLGCERLLCWDNAADSISLSELFAGGSFMIKARKHR